MDADALRRRREDEDDYPDCFDDCHRDCEAVGGEKTCYCLMIPPSRRRGVLGTRHP